MKIYSPSKIACLIFALCITSQAHAYDIITELGAGWKSDSHSSPALSPNCHKVFHERDFWRYRTESSCGGNNPMFFGWVVGWREDYYGGKIAATAGVYHLSHWFDNGREVYATFPAASVTIRWNRILR